MDLQQCVGLLRHGSVKAWVESNRSSLLWINTQKVYGIADWATSFSTRIIEYSGRIEYAMVLYYFCGNRPISSQASAVTVTIQSMIMQILQVHHKKFVSRKLFPFTLEHFEDAADDISELWNLLLSCIAEADLKCVWLVIDNSAPLEFGLLQHAEVFINERQVMAGFVSREISIHTGKLPLGHRSKYELIQFHGLAQSLTLMCQHCLSK